MMKHTAGPWRVDLTVALGAYGVWTEYGVNPGDVSGQLYPVQICNVYPCNESDVPREQRDANARLIAAAPDLLRELESCRALLDELLTWRLFDDSIDQIKERLEAARAAIAKATESST